MHISNAISISGRFFGGYTSRLVSAYVKRVTDDGGVVEAKGCVKAAFIELGAAPVSFSFLLDTYSGAAAAYSLRKLRSAYTGNAIKVRRSSDNTEQDIGFVDNELDVATLESFCSGTNGFVTTWYDQSGNGNDAEQTTAASQPQIVSSGSVITENGKSAVEFDGSDDSLQATNPSVSYQSFGCFGVQSVNSGTAFALNSNPRFYFPISRTTFIAMSYDNIDFAPLNSSFGTQFLLSSSADATNCEVYDNDVLVKNDASISATSDRMIIGYNGGTSYFGGKSQEVILYATNQLSNVSGINTNINDFYSIYP